MTSDAHAFYVADAPSAAVPMTLAYRFTQHEHGSFPIARAALGSCDLSILNIGGEWHNNAPVNGGSVHCIARLRSPLADCKSA
jgi:hypothetical protein